MPKIVCSFCRYTLFWNIRRGRKKCKRCRKEFSSVQYPISGFRITEKEWRDAIGIFLRERTIRSIVRSTTISHYHVEKMVQYLRACMLRDVPSPFSGIVEMDETYIGGQRKNKRLHIRRIKGKRGHGTEKLAIVGIFGREAKQVYVQVIRKLSMPDIFLMLDMHVVKGSPVYTDGFKPYRGLPKKGYPHEYVNHAGGEYVRGDIHTNNIEGFWGILKRKMSCIGGMRADRLEFFVAEIVWKFNHRCEPIQIQEKKLFELLFR